METVSARSRIMIVEDDELSAKMLALYLEKNGFAVSIEPRGDRAVNRVLGEHPDVVILDIGLPGKDGFTVCRELRAGYPGIIVMLTAHGDNLDQILGLELGADDYVTKPAEPRVLLARVRACMRRKSPATIMTAETRRFGPLHIDPANRTVRLDDRDLDLTGAEFDLLWLLVCNPGHILSRDDIYMSLRGIAHDGIDRSIDMRISRLRKLLGSDSEGRFRIKTVRGKGYLFSASAGKT